MIRILTTTCEALLDLVTEALDEAEIDFTEDMHEDAATGDDVYTVFVHHTDLQGALDIVADAEEEVAS